MTIYKIDVLKYALYPDEKDTVDIIRFYISKADYKKLRTSKKLISFELNNINLLVEPENELLEGSWTCYTIFKGKLDDSGKLRHPWYAVHRWAPSVYSFIRRLYESIYS